MRLSTVLAALSLALPGAAQWNIDLDDPGAPPQLGGGLPSDSFGAAAGQAGRWNAFYGIGPIAMVDIHGNSSPLALSLTSTLSGISYFSSNFAGNTGALALLLNDAADVGSFVDGGTLTMTFAGMPAGMFDVYTYAVSPAGNPASCSVRVLGASVETQTVTGPMPGNVLAYGITHSVHRISLAEAGVLIVSATQAPQSNGCFVNGLQIVPVPEPSGWIVVSTSLLLIWRAGAQGERLRASGRSLTSPAHPRRPATRSRTQFLLLPW